MTPLSCQIDKTTSITPDSKIEHLKVSLKCTDFAENTLYADGKNAKKSRDIADSIINSSYVAKDIEYHADTKGIKTEIHSLSYYDKLSNSLYVGILKMSESK